MSNKLVAYFSATGTTAKVANRLADAINADVFEIEPQEPYTEADLNWKDTQSRSSLEINDPSSRPSIARRRNHMEEYDTIYIGFPIWWYVAPTIINSFLESYDFSGKTIIPFATSSGSGMEKVNDALKVSCPDSKLLEGTVFLPNISLRDLSDWADFMR